MKADFQKLSSSSFQNSFVDFWVKSDAFGFHWHYHPEIELCYVKHGRGKRIIGESIEDFEDGDLVLVGSNVPHSWITDEQFNASSNQIEVFVLQFGLDIFNGFENLPEFHSIKKILDESAKGLYIHQPSASILLKLTQISETDGIHKLTKLIELLHDISEHGMVIALNIAAYGMVHKKHQEDRILKVCNYIHEHYKNTISISELANLVAMNNASFCRFFKRMLGKTVVEYINELRISYVCQKIQNTKQPIYQIAYETGYTSLAHFNKQFKRSTGRTPTQYRSYLNNRL